MSDCAHALAKNLVEEDSTGYDLNSDGTDRDHAKGAELATTGEDRPGQETLERCCAWPRLQEEPE